MNDNTAGKRAPDSKPAKAGHEPDRHGDRPDPDSQEELLDEAIEESFPASDPPASTQPATGWVEADEDEKESRKDD
jgi:hypothetical protein